MAKHSLGSGQSWKTFLRNHAAGIGAMDLLVVPTIGFRLLFVLVILRLERQRLLSVGVTYHPTAEWIAQQITEAFPWDEAPDHLIRDRDTAYGPVVTHRLIAMGIRDHPIAPRSPWQAVRACNAVAGNNLDPRPRRLDEHHVRSGHLAAFGAGRLPFDLYARR
jgi:hypothetical protein